MFPGSIQSDITIYNLFEDTTGLQQMQPTVVSGVFWQGNYGSTMTVKGITTTDKVSVMILKDTIIEDKTYLPSLDFLKLPYDQKLLHWTITKGDKFLNVVIDGLISKTKDLEKKYGYDNVLTVSSFMFNDFGSENMRHFKIIGK